MPSEWLDFENRVAAGEPLEGIAARLGTTRTSLIRFRRHDAAFNAAWTRGRERYAARQGMKAELCGEKVMLVGLTRSRKQERREKAMEFLKTRPGATFDEITHGARVGEQALSEILAVEMLDARRIRFQVAGDTTRYFLTEAGYGEVEAARRRREAIRLGGADAAQGSPHGGQVRRERDGQGAAVGVLLFGREVLGHGN